MNSVIAKANADWTEKAIEACRNDPSVAAAGLCPVCMCKLPDCLCEIDKRRDKMRRFYEAHNRFWKGRKYTSARPGYLHLGHRDQVADLIDGLQRIACGYSTHFEDALLDGTLQVGEGEKPGILSRLGFKAP